MLPSAWVRPRGGGVAAIDDEAVFAAIVHVLVSGCAWRASPPCFGASIRCSRALPGWRPGRRRRSGVRCGCPHQVECRLAEGANAGCRTVGGPHQTPVH
ncbi:MULTISPECIES: transposase [Streptomyces]|uniref:transposase n=1 Tax=Streptomyces TaxID=1883 RepID=UPI0021F1271D|nr:transposase [Streptomyces triticiradicis]